MAGAVDLNRLEQQKQAVRHQEITNMFSIATNIVLKHTDLVINGTITKEELCKHANEISEEHFKQLKQWQIRLAESDKKEQDSGKLYTGS